MTTTPIHASDEITVRFGVDEVWRVLADVGGYPRWWPGSLRLRVLSAGAGPLGTEVEIHPAGGRAFRCRVESVELHRHIRMRYLGGFIEGCGEWVLEPQGGETRVTYRLDASAQGWLVALIGKLVDLGGLHSRSMRSVLAHLELELARERRPAQEGR